MSTLATVGSRLFETSEMYYINNKIRIKIIIIKFYQMVLVATELSKLQYFHVISSLLLLFSMIELKLKLYYLLYPIKSI